MAKVFLDTNIFIDAIHRYPENDIADELESHTTYISPLSAHIYCYIYKIKVPNKALPLHLRKFTFVDLTDKILSHSIKGPTDDLEDNIQLHSAAESECELFLTSDEKLLKMKYFGKTQIIDHLGKN